MGRNGEPVHFPIDLYRCVKCDVVVAPLPRNQPRPERGADECPVCHDKVVFLGRVLATAPSSAEESWPGRW